MADQKNEVTNGFKAFWWVMGLVSILLAAGVVGAVATYAQVGKVDTNVTLLRGEVQREMDRQNGRIQSLEAKLDNYILAQNRNGA